MYIFGVLAEVVEYLGVLVEVAEFFFFLENNTFSTCICRNDYRECVIYKNSTDVVRQRLLRHHVAAQATYQHLAHCRTVTM